MRQNMSAPKNVLAKSMAAQSFFFRLAVALAIVVLFAVLARAGGPKYVAGSSYFNASTMGQPLSWSLGQVNYYTDQGDLSPILPNNSANILVANAFAQWTSSPTSGLTVTGAGELAEDVNGSNIAVNSAGVVTAPADIAPSATKSPVGIVYDFDGSVTDALLGAGAGAPSQCFWNAVYGGVDNFAATANFLHALVVINGQCALQSSQLTDVEYRLVRVLGGVLGLGWSQMNVNVITLHPPPTAADYAGFPVMHYLDPVSCVPITVCYANPYELAADDVAALSRLYPASPPSAITARIYGSVYFADHVGSSGQPMQGVNVVARWIDPSTNQPSDQYGASSVSGFLFSGNAGNPITGLADPLGNLYSEFGSSDVALEGFFDLGGLPIPNGANTAQYELSVEALDPMWSAGVCPYDPSQVAPSGTFLTMVVTVAAGGDVEQDVLMSGSAQAVPPLAVTQSWSSPAPVLSPGDWVGSLSGYGGVGYFLIAAQANRTLSVAVTALDETSAPSESKAAPVVGMWTQGDPLGTAPPAFTQAAFNSDTFGMSRLDTQILASNSFVIGIADLRGDGRPDYHYHAHVLYGDSVDPPRVPVTGGPVVLQGTGFAPGLAVAVGSVSAPLLATNASQMLATVPGHGDGPQTITISDPVSGAFSIMTGVLMFGATSTDGASSCSAISDESGMASTWVTSAATGSAVITATLAPGLYSPVQSVGSTLSATSTSLDIGVNPPNLWIAAGASLSVPLTSRLVSLGAPQSGKQINFFIDQGSGSLSSTSAVTNSSGYASVNLTVTNFAVSMQLSACAGPGNNPCQNISVNAVAAGLMNLQSVAGAGQVVSGGAFQPLTVRVTDSSTPPNPLLGATVLFQSTLVRPAGNDLILTPGDPTVAPTGMPVFLGASQNTTQSNVSGLASFTPSVGLLSGPLEIEIQVSAGTSAALQDVMETFPAAGNGNTSPSASSQGYGMTN
jgi:hypothetical protein